jgi:hypothetical protein
MNNPNEKQCISQKQALLELLLSGFKVTVLDGYNHLDCIATSQRVSNLILEDGFPIQREWMITNTGKKIKQYFL